MANSEKLILAPGQTKFITIENRGASGLQLIFQLSGDIVIDVRREESTRNEHKELMEKNVGGSIPALFSVTAIKKGKATITFLETQPWNPSFKEITCKVIKVEVK